MSDFHLFSKAVTARFNAMSKNELFVVDTLDIFDSYLASFPAGTNPIFRTNTEHDCSCCKAFVRNIGKVVAIVDGMIQTVWDVEVPYPYSEVAKAMAGLVRQAPIVSVFRTKEKRYGTAYNYDDDGHRWDHFEGAVAAKHYSTTPDTVKGDRNAIAQVLRRGLLELKASAFDDVLDLIDSNSIYRGAEHKASVVEFRKLQQEFLASKVRADFVWANLDNRAARFRNTVIGTLITDISDGVELEKAVKSFEAKVAPLNYKRPKSLITPRMIEDAVKKIAELGLEPALERRFARIEDVSVNNVLFVNNSVKGQMKDAITTLLSSSVVAKPVDVKGATPISVEDFLATIVPQATSIELLVENRHLGNFMSLTAPVNGSTGQLFKWANDFAWSYDGDVTDSMKERVKKAGGNVNADLRVSLSWSNYDDLDIHAHAPAYGRIYYGNKAGVLDVDMNVSPTTREAVENLAFMRPANGDYRIAVNQFTYREAKDAGFTLEVECNGITQQFACPVNPPARGTIDCLTLKMKDGQLLSTRIDDKRLVAGAASSADKWGITTQQLVPVDTLLASPNHWDDREIGNKHWFFILKNCKNPDSVRGIYNEFLNSALDEHRKVFEVLGAKTKCPPSDKQLSGVGFSSTRNDTATVVVNKTRAYTIKF
jgi:hypothetical protein